MLALAPGTMTIYFCIGPTDMRKGFDGLMRLAEQQAARDVLQGGLFIFVNRRRDRVKLLWWDEDGLAIWYKRLEAGTFELPAVNEDVNHVSLTPTELSLLLGGIELASVRRRKRFRQTA
jgi:transposase